MSSAKQALSTKAVQCEANYQGSNPVVAIFSRICSYMYACAFGGAHWRLESLQISSLRVYGSARVCVRAV